MKNEERIIELLLELNRKQNAFDSNFGGQIDGLASLESTFSSGLDRIEKAVVEIIKETDKQTKVIKRMSDKMEKIFK